MNHTAKSTRHDHAWGLYFGTEAIRLARVVRTVEGYRAEQFGAAPLAAPTNAAIAAAVISLPPIPSGEPLILCVDDEWVLYRRLLLPRTDDATLARMVEAQAQVVLPGSAELSWTWTKISGSPDDGQQQVLLCAVRLEKIAAIVTAGQRLGTIAQIVPAGFALALGALTTGGIGAQATALIDARPHRTTLMLISAGVPHACSVCDEPHGTGDANWMRRIGQLYRECAQGMAAPPPIVLLAAGDASVLASSLTSALQHLVEPLNVNGRVALPESVPVAHALAPMGAALHALESGASTLTLAAPSETAPQRKTSPKRVGWFAAWIFAAIAGLYFADIYHAGQVNRILNDQRAAAGEDLELTQRMALGSWLEQRPTVPLPLLEELSAIASPSLLLSAIDYSGDGQVRIAGQLGGIAELHSLLEALAKSPLFTDVQPRRVTMNRDRWIFEISARAAPLTHFLARPPREEKPEVGGQS